MSRRPVRVVVLLSDGLASRGGIGRVVGYLLRNLGTVAPDIEAVPMAARWSVGPMVKHLSVPLALGAFVRTLIARRIAIVHVNIAPRGSTWRKMIYAEVAKLMNRKVLLHLHGSAYDEYFASLNPSRQSLVRRLFQGATRVIVLGDNWQRFVVGTLGVPAERVVEIANGVPEALGLSPKATHDVPLIVTFGLLGKRKGTDVLLEALAQLTGRGVSWRAVIGGDGEIAAAREQAETLRIADRIHFPGWVDEETVDQSLRQADIFVLPSRGENQPVSILEAMARRTPVVATRVGAIPLQIDDGRTGLLVCPEDVTGLADALQTLIEDPARRVAMGEAGLARFEADFSARACAERFAGLYREVMRDRG